MDNQMDLAVTITGDAASVVSAADQAGQALTGFEGVSSEALASLTASLDKLNLNLDGMTAAAHRSATGVKEVGGAAETTNSALKQLESHSGTVARGFNAMGLEAEGAAARVEGLAGTLVEMQEAAPGLLLVAGALAAVVGTFSFFKEGVDSAAEMQRTMQQLSAVVQENGQSWDATKGKVEDFFNTESMASGFTREELAKSLQDLTTRLGDVNAGMEALRIAEELARGTGMSLSEAERTLTELMGGRYMTLERLDPKIKEMVKDHASTRDILIELHKHYRDAIADANDLATMKDREKVAHEEAAEAIGTMMLPALISLEKTMIGAWKNTQTFAQDWGIMWQGMALVVRGAIQAIKDDLVGMAKAEMDFVNGNWGAIPGDLNTGNDQGRAMMTTGEQIIRSASLAMDQRPTAYDAGDAAVAGAVAKHDADLINQINSLNGLPAISGRSGKAGHAGHTGGRHSGASANAWKNNPAGSGEGLVLYDDILGNTTKNEDAFTKALYANGIALGEQTKKLLEARDANAKKNEEERATYGMSTQQQIAYYKAELDNLDKFDKDYLQKATELQNKLDDLQTKAYKEQIDAQKKAHDEQIKQIETFADKGVTLFNSFFEKGKHGMSAFSDAFKKMLDDMLVSLERSELTRLLERMFGVTTGGSTSSALPGGYNGGSNPASTAGTIASLFGLGSRVGIGSTGPNSTLTGVPTYSDIMSGTNTSSLPMSAGQQGPGISQLASTDVNASPYIGIFLAQQAFAHMMGERAGGGAHDTWASIGALLFGFPGALVGSMFGPHFNPANEPDIYQQDAWGQQNADMVGGEWTANGKQYNPDSWTTQLTKNRGWNIVMENFVQKFRGKTSTLPKGLQAVFQDIDALWGGASGQAMFNHDGKDGYLDIGSGKRAKWSEFWQYVSAYGPQIAQLMDNYDTTNVYDSSNGSATAAGSYSPDGSPYILHDFPDYSGAAMSAPPASGSVPAPIGGHGSPVGGGGGYGGGYGGVHGVSPMGGQIFVQQTVYGNVVTENQLTNKVNTAIGQYGRQPIRGMNLAGK